MVRVDIVTKQDDCNDTLKGDTDLNKKGIKLDESNVLAVRT